MGRKAPFSSCSSAEEVVEEESFQTDPERSYSRSKDSMCQVHKAHLWHHYRKGDILTNRPEETETVPASASPWKIVLGELDEKMGVRIVEESAERVVATMPVAGNRQSFGLLHGGASLAVGEAVGSWAAVIHASTLGRTAVGIDVSATHHRSAREGLLTITATPIHLGRTLTTHEVLIHNEDDQRLCTLRITNLLMEKKP